MIGGKKFSLPFINFSPGSFPVSSDPENKVADAFKEYMQPLKQLQLFFSLKSVFLEKRFGKWPQIQMEP